MRCPTLYIVVPCYNEQEVLPVTSGQFLNKLTQLIQCGKISEQSRILFVNDGSSDDTWKIITELSKKDQHFIGISQSRNRGHQNAVLAGLMEAKGVCDVTISIDCDGQDDLNAMDEMIDRYQEGNEIVYGVRDNRDTDTFFKRVSAESFYKLLNWMGVESVYNHADYRLISSKALEALSEFEEVNIFLRGMVPLVGYRSTSVYYARKERLAGKSHYPLKKMIALAVDGITSLSIKPIRLITFLGALAVLISCLGIVWAVVSYVMKRTVSGWASIICLMGVMSGVQMMSLGVIGEYIGKIYLETKHRPRYIISERTGWDSREEGASEEDREHG